MVNRNVVKQIRQATRRKFSADEKIRIVLEGLRGEVSVSELCRVEGIAPTMYYRWSKSFLEAGKNGLTLDTKRDATSDEVRRLKEENGFLKKALAESVLEVQRLKKAWACKAEVSEDEQTPQIGSPQCRRRIGTADIPGLIEDRRGCIHLLPLEEEVQGERSGGFTGQIIGPYTALEHDPTRGR